MCIPLAEHNWVGFFLLWSDTFRPYQGERGKRETERKRRREEEERKRERERKKRGREGGSYFSFYII